MNERVLLCGIGKLENNYIREWVEYHKNLGFTNIVLYDNNDVNGERFESVIGDYIKSGYVILKDWRGKKLAQIPSYNACYKEYESKYDWIAFWDIDEFIKFEKVKTIQEFLSQSIFKQAQCIRIGWKQYTDNGLVSVVNGNYSVTRFKEVFDEQYCRKHKISTQRHLSANTQAKSIIRTGIKDFKVTSPHCFLNVPTVNAVGEKANIGIQLGKQPVWKGAWLNHYRFKTIEEYATKKMVRLWPTAYLNGGKDGLTLDFFFKFNERTQEKVNFVKNLSNGVNRDKTVYVNAWVEGTNAGNIKNNNWGDDINFFFLSKIFNKSVVKASKKQPDNYCLIGSILCNGFVNNDTTVWGSGIQVQGKLRYKPRKVCAVRGPLTRKYLINQGIECPEIYGDPSLLLPYYYNPDVPKKYKIGFIPHWSSLGSPIVRQFLNDDRVHLIKLKNYDSWLSVIDEIVSCEYIVSESLHGLIMAEAYGIPNLWVDITLKHVYDTKFHDFFLSLQADRQASVKVDKNLTVEKALELLKNYKKGKMVDLVKLVNACPIEIGNTEFLNRVKESSLPKSKPQEIKASTPKPKLVITNPKYKNKIKLRSGRGATIHTFYS